MLSDDERTAPRATLSGRLVSTLIWVAASSVLIATCSVLVLADTVIRGRLERSIDASARLLAVELSEGPLPSDDDLEAEVRELEINGRVSLVDLDEGEPAPCGLRRASARPTEYVCVQRIGNRGRSAVSVAVPATRLTEHRMPLFFAGLATMLGVGVAAVFVGRRLAVGVVAPIESLSSSIAAIDASDPSAAALPTDLPFVELASMRDRVGELVRRIDEELTRTRAFSSAAAHELRTPLAKMRAELDLAIEELPAGHDASALLDRLRTTTGHMARLSERLLMLARPSDDTVDELVSLAAIVEEIPDRWSDTGDGRLELDVAEGDALVRGEGLLLTMMVDNLVENALKFSDGPVRIHVREGDGVVVLEVEDDGPGVPSALAEDLFEPFERRAPSGRSSAGAGLGLALVARVAADCKGSVHFDPAYTDGARIVVRLPLWSSSRVAEVGGSGEAIAAGTTAGDEH